MVFKHGQKVIAICARKASLLFWVAIDPGAAGAARHSVIPANHARLAQIPPAHNHRVCLICVVLNRDDFNVRRRKTRFYEKVREIRGFRPVFVSVHRGVLRQASFKKLLDLCGKRAVLYFTSEKERET